MRRFNFNFGGTPQEEFRLPRFSFDQPRERFDLANTEPIPATMPRQPSRSAYDRFMRTQEEMPIYGDKQYEHGKWGKLGSILAGAAVGGLSGDIDRGVHVGKQFLDSKYNKALQSWEQRFKSDKAAAIEERQREDLERKGRLDESNIRKNNADAAATEETVGLNRREKLARIEASLANAGVDEARRMQIMDDINNPDLVKESDNKGGINFYNKKTGELVKRHDGVNLSAKELKDIDYHNDRRLNAQQGDIGARNLRIQLGGFKELEDKRQGNREKTEGIRLKNNLILEGARNEGRMNLQNDAQSFKAENPGDVQRHLTNPQYKREFANALAELETQDPRNKELILQHFQRDAAGNVGLRDPEDPESIALYNKVTTYLRSKGVK